jgi:hypothetical protein
MPRITLLFPTLLLLACANKSSPEKADDDEAEPSERNAHKSEESSPCSAAIDSLVATGTVILGMEGLAWGDMERLEFIPLPETRDGTRIEQINRFHGGRGTQDAKDHFVCEDGSIEIPRFDTEVGRFWESYDPAMLWSRAPLEEGQSWTWTGFSHNRCADPDDCSHEDARQATAAYEVLAAESLQTAIGPLSATPLRMEWSWAGDERPQIIQTTWFLTEAPMVMVHRERRIETAPGEFIEGTLKLISIENPPD